MKGKYFITDLFKKILLHGILICITTLSILTFIFHYILPKTTYQSSKYHVKVPNLKGLSIKEAREALTEKQLIAVITKEQIYSADYEPLAILKQNPLPGMKVKPSRKIYLTLNTEDLPTTKMPNLIDQSIKNAVILLENQDLKLGEIEYKKDFAKNAVLAQYHKGEEILPKTVISKGSLIDLVVGTGIQNMDVEVPNLVGEKLGHAMRSLVYNGLKGSVIIQEKNKAENKQSTVAKQYPTANSFKNIGSTVYLWLTDSERLPNEEALKNNEQKVK